jgi:hypothetical protein
MNKMLTCSFQRSCPELSNISIVSNSTSPTTVEGNTTQIGPNYIRKDSDLQTIILAIKSSMENDRLKAGIY